MGRPPVKIEKMDGAQQDIKQFSVGESSRSALFPILNSGKFNTIVRHYLSIK